MRNSLPHPDFPGKTYTLDGPDQGRGDYFRICDSLLDVLVREEGSPATLLRIIRTYSYKRRRLRMLLRRDRATDGIACILRHAHEMLAPFMPGVESHLKGLSFKNLWDRRLGTTREQYYLHMLEVCLVNRINRAEFLNCDRKIALLPYCLQDFSVKCKAAPDGTDYRCAHCSKNCYQNAVSRILEQHGIEPFIWMESDFKVLHRQLRKTGKSLGVLGIACFPELAWGIHTCAKAGIPAIGLPLDGNRCIRWWGDFHQNSVNLGELELLIS